MPNIIKRSSEYAWTDCQLFLGKRPVFGFTGFSYKVARTVTLVYASGDDPHTINRGNKEPSGSITLLQSDFEAFVQAAKTIHGENADPTDVDWEASISYVAKLGGRIVTDQIIGGVFTDWEKALKQNDPNMQIEMPFKCLQIKLDV